MSVSTREQLRRVWFNVHLWIGVGLALMLIPLSLSGSYLVWRDEIDRAAHPARYAVTAGPANLAASAYLDAAQTAFGERARVSGLKMPAHPGDPVTVTGAMGRGGPDGDHARRGKAGEGAAPAQPAAGGRAKAPAQAGGPRRQQVLTAWLDPASARVLDVANTRQGFSMWVHDLHGQFFVFGTGRLVVGWFGVAMLVSCLTGLWLWWPRGGGSPAKGLRWRRSPSTLLNLHHLVGFWIALPLAALSLSGALISFPAFTRSLAANVGPVTPQQPGRGPGGPGGAPARHTTLSADQAAAAALAAVPGARLAGVTLPLRSDEAPSWRIQLRRAGKGPVTVAVDDAEGGAARIVPERPRLAGDQLIRFNRQVHDGDDLGLVWKVIITLAGIAPALLGVTGVIVWATRLGRKRAMRRRLDGALPEPSPAE